MGPVIDPKAQRRMFLDTMILEDLDALWKNRCVAFGQPAPQGLNRLQMTDAIIAKEFPQQNPLVYDMANRPPPAGEMPPGMRMN